MAYAYTQQTWNTPRFFGFLAALGINAILILGLASALIVKEPAPEPELKWVDVVDPTVTPPVPPPPQPTNYDAGERPDLGPEPFFPVPLQHDSGPVIELPTPDVGTGTAGSAAPVVTKLEVDPAYFVAPNYPPRSIALEEEGTVQLLVYVLPDGRVGDVQVSRSSGFARLDSAALKTAKAKWRFRPRTQDGMAVAGWGTYAVKFKLE